ncbi:MAG: hypothetical protein GEU81_04745 [Nitriliruptorales bacterium]|nr:hypothetical protein [Nitriliruptorales bacterium]
MWLLRSRSARRAPKGLVRLVPSFDTSLLGYPRARRGSPRGTRAQDLSRAEGDLVVADPAS